MRITLCYTVAYMLSYVVNSIISIRQTSVSQYTI